MADHDATTQAFLSYTHADDDYLDGGITWLGRELQRAMRAITGTPFEIFQDVDAIAFGDHWPSRIEDALERARFLIPILTPSYFASPNCRAEAAAFLDLEKRAGRRDLVLPIYLIEAEVLEDAERRAGDAVVDAFFKRQYADWRDTAFDLRNAAHVKQRVFDLARQIKAARACRGGDAPPIVPAQGGGIRFRLNADGRIDRAPDEPTAVKDDDPRLRSLQAGLQEACSTFLNSFHGDSGRNAFGLLIDRVEAYRDAISVPLSEIQLTDVYRHGLALRNWRLAGRRNIERLDPRPDLEDDQQAALCNLLSLHGPFILSTREGEALQAKADRSQLTESERAELWSPAFGAAAGESDHATERAKAVLAEVNRPDDQDAYPERRALLALSTNRNFLMATGDAATGKNVFDVGEEAAARASRDAGGFLLKNESLIRHIARPARSGFAWLEPFLTWLRGRRIPAITVRPARQQTPALDAAGAEGSWTPGHVFRDIEAPWCPEMVVIPAGGFMMGSPDDEDHRMEREGPRHRVMIAKPFALARFPTTFEEFDRFCGETGHPMPEDEGWGRGRRPVINVFRKDVLVYCEWLSGKTGKAYRLPSEAEWEYACRAGSDTAYSFGSEIDERQAHFDQDRKTGTTSKVGAYPVNAFGIYDMHGNVWEWCEDCFHQSYEGAPTDGSPWTSRNKEIYIGRGGSWANEEKNLRSAIRGIGAPDERARTMGFRCARVL